MKALWQILAQLANVLPDNLNDRNLIIGTALKVLSQWFLDQAEPQGMRSATPEDDDDLDLAIEHCQRAIVALGGAVPMMAAGNDRREKLMQLLKVLLPLLLA